MNENTIDDVQRALNNEAVLAGIKQAHKLGDLQRQVALLMPQVTKMLEELKLKKSTAVTATTTSKEPQPLPSEQLDRSVGPTTVSDKLDAGLKILELPQSEIARRQHADPETVRVLQNREAEALVLEAIRAAQRPASEQHAPQGSFTDLSRSAPAGRLEKSAAPYKSVMTRFGEIAEERVAAAKRRGR